MTARIIDVAIPQKNFRELTIDVGVILGNGAPFDGIRRSAGLAELGRRRRHHARHPYAASSRHLHRMPISFFTGTKTGEIMNRVSSDVDNVDNVVTGTLTTIITNVVIILTTVVAMFVWNWRLR